ncbi:MAG: exodeoxyribonuclease VII small subunit [Ignavibacteria bacterium]|jgi:exodeoxyribonuclease VII small subunit|nr:exodeoxyribonuclease VII small subunit [Ignavibacteria bacterium]
MAKKTELTPATFELKMERLREIGSILDSSNKSIDDMIHLYEEGIQVAQECRAYLAQAEGKVIDISQKYSNTELIAEK